MTVISFHIVIAHVLGCMHVQGFLIMSPLTDKFIDFNSRTVFAYRAALIEDELYKVLLIIHLVHNTNEINLFYCFNSTPIKSRSIINFVACKRKLSR